MKTYGSRLKRSISNPSSASKQTSLRRRSLSGPGSLQSFRRENDSEGNCTAPSFADPYECDGGEVAESSDPYGFNEAKHELNSIPHRPSKRRRGDNQVDEKDSNPVVERAGSAVANASHEDRAKLDDIEYLLDGLKPSQSLSVRQSSGIELARMLKHGDVAFQLRTYMGYDRIFSCFESQLEDGLMCYICATIACLVAEESKNTKLYEAQSFVSCLMKLLEKMDPTILTSSATVDGQCGRSSRKRRRRREGSRKTPRGKGMNKESILAIVDWEKCERDELSQVSPSVLAIRALCAAVGEENFRDLIITKHSGVAKLLLEELERKLKLFLPFYNKTSALTDSVESKETRNVARLILLRTISSVENLTHEDVSELRFIRVVGEEWVGRLLVSFRGIISTYLNCGHLDEFLFSMIAGSFRVLVNLTNNQESGVKLTSDLLPLIFKITHYCASIKEHQNDVFDLRAAALGVLINCCEQSEACCTVISQCSLPDGMTSLKYFVGMLRENRQNDTVESRALASYSAMLLGFLVKASPQSQEIVKGYLDSDNYNELTEVLQDFIILQCKANMLTEESLKSLVRVVDFLQKAGSKTGHSV